MWQLKQVKGKWAVADRYSKIFTHLEPAVTSYFFLLIAFEKE